MKKIIVLLVAIISSCCLTGSASAQIIHRQKSKTEKQSSKSSSQQSKGLKALFKDNLGRYPYEFKMFENKALRNRLCKIMGEKQFNYLVKELSDVQTPIEYSDFCYNTFMMKTHGGGDLEAWISYNPKLDAIAVTINYHGDYKSYGEKGFSLSERLIAL